MVNVESPELSIIIINWNSIAFLRACLNSLYKKIDRPSFEIIVVDNASYDGSAEILRDEYPSVHFIQSDKNLGFSKGNNLGYQHSSGKALLFLNPDTELLDHGLAELYDHLFAAAHIGAVGCRLVNSDLSPQLQYVQTFPTICNQILTTDFLIRMFPKCRLWNVHPLARLQGGAVDVDVLAGSCIMVKREAFERAGRFNEAYFMYAEDVDLCYMIRRAGFAIQFLGKATVVHHGGKSSGSARDGNFASVMHRESIATFFKQRKGAAYSRAYRIATASASIARLALLICGIPLAVVLSKSGRLDGARTKWTKVLRWSVGLEGWASIAAPGELRTVVPNVPKVS